MYNSIYGIVDFYSSVLYCPLATVIYIIIISRIIGHTAICLVRIIILTLKIKIFKVPLPTNVKMFWRNGGGGRAPWFSGGGQRTCLWSSFAPATLRVPEMKLGSSCMQSKCFCLLNHLPSPDICFFTKIDLMDKVSRTQWIIHF